MQVNRGDWELVDLTAVIFLAASGSAIDIAEEETEEEDEPDDNDQATHKRNLASLMLECQEILACG